MNVLALIPLFLVILNSNNACLTSSEEYATEVVVPDYNYDSVRLVASATQDYFASESQYSKDLLSIIQQSDNPPGLSIRLQIPTEIKEIRKPRIKILSDSSSGTLRENIPEVINGWKTRCDSNQCEFEKDLVTLTISKNTKQVSIEINKKLNTCDSQCTGICFEASTESKCIEAKTKTDLDIMLKYSGISPNLREVLKSYKISGSEELVLQDIVPTVDQEINFPEAMKQELVHLSNKGVINLAKDDIESITVLAKQGRAGNNYRIVYDKDSESWAYYNILSNAVLTDSKDCRAYGQVQNSPSIVDSIKAPFYLVPVVITLTGIIALLVLLIVARVIVSRREKV